MPSQDESAGPNDRATYAVGTLFVRSVRPFLERTLDKSFLAVVVRTCSPLQPELPPMPSAPPMTPEMSSDPMPQPSRQPQPMGPTPEANASMPTSVGVDLGPHGPPETTWAMPCSRSRRQSPTAPQPTPLPQETPPPSPPPPSQRDKEAAEVARRPHQRQQDESEVAYHQALAQGCPKCHRSDRLSRKGSSHLIHNLRCERCSLRIGSKRVG